MLTFSLFIALFSVLITTTITTTPPYIPTDCILINCGSSTNSTSSDLRFWEGDTFSKYSPSNLNDVSSRSTAVEQAQSVPSVPFSSARIIHALLTYSFPVSAGPKFVRLYFYPATYSNLDITTYFFTVKANGYTLLSNFSPFLTVTASLNSNSRDFIIIKEFIITVLQSQKLNITLFPESQNNQNPNYAFINGIEIVSMPDPLYYRTNGDNLVKLIYPNGHTSSIEIENNTALENVYRLNVGGNDVSITDDTGMYRMWQQDAGFLIGTDGLTPYLGTANITYTKNTPAYVAPEIVYTTSRTMGDQGFNLYFNLTWIFTVDSGFSYLVRLHFCETQLEAKRQNQRVFYVFINNQTAEENFDVIQRSGGFGFPIYRDYVIEVPDLDGSGSKQVLWLAMHPNINSTPQLYNAILNGLEIFKMNKSDGSLAGSHPDPVVQGKEPPVSSILKHTRSSHVKAIAGGVIGCTIVAICVICCIIVAIRSETKTSWVSFLYMSKKSTRSSTTSPLLSDLCHHFLLSELRLATSNFHDNFVIGVGGFGNVYRGCLENGSSNVAIKRLNPSSKQGVHEFETEIKVLSKLRHIHLVSLVGYSDDEGEMILVYDYMANGTLRDHLYKTKNPPLSWKKRLEICIGAARGLHYLHTGAKHSIIHRDVKSTNILLDEKWVAKVADFGLSKVGPRDASHTHVSTLVKGSFGYLDPEYFRSQQLTEKSDVYSFGVVLFEVLCARPAVIQEISMEQVNLAEWGKTCYRKGVLNQIIDKNLKGQIASESLKKFVKIANNCLKDKGTERPTMRDVVWTLEFALQLQETADQKIMGECGVEIDEMSTESSSTVSDEFMTRDEVTGVFTLSSGHLSGKKEYGDYITE